MILLTRPEAASDRFAARLRAAGIGAEVTVSPLLRIEPLPGDVALEGVAGVLFSSANGVAAVAGRDLPAWCVGDATAAAARARGWRAVSAGGDAEALYRRVLADAPQGPLLHLRGEHARGDLAARLSAAGIETREVVIYRQLAQALNPGARDLLNGKNPVIVPLFSPRTAGQLAAEGPFAAPLWLVAISPAVARELSGLDAARLMVAERPDAQEMINVVHRLCDTD